MSRVDDMTRLCGQVQAGRRERKSFVANLVSGGAARRAAVGAVCVANANANEARRRSLMASLSAFMANLAANEKDRQQEAARLRKALAAFVNTVVQDVASLTRDVASARKANRAENAAARNAWCGVVVAVTGKRGAKSTSPAA